jgi:hypothetical protein
MASFLLSPTRRVSPPCCVYMGKYSARLAEIPAPQIEISPRQASRFPFEHKMKLVIKLHIDVRSWQSELARVPGLALFHINTP